MKVKTFRKKDWLIEFYRLKEIVKTHFEEDGLRNLKEIISKLTTYHYNKRKYILLGQERELYNFLIENSFNPFTVYRWFLLERVPEDVRFQLKTIFIVIQL